MEIEKFIKEKLNSEGAQLINAPYDVILVVDCQEDDDNFPFKVISYKAKLCYASTFKKVFVIDGNEKVNVQMYDKNKNELV